MLQQCLFPVTIVFYSRLCFPKALILGTATHGSIPSHETPLPVPIKSIPFNKCWKKKCSIHLRILSFFFFNFSSLNHAGFLPLQFHTLSYHRAWACNSLMLSGGGVVGEGHFTDSDKLLWNDRSLVFSWVCETFLTASSHHQHECK